MASHIYPVSEVHRTVTRPITMDIIREVLEMTRINPEDFRTKMLGYTDAVSVPGSTLDDGKTQSPNRLSTDESLTMEITEEDVGINETAVRYPNHVPFFYDPKLRITMKPVLSLSKATIAVVISVPSRVRANNWLSEIKRRIYHNHMTNYHTVQYHYPIPKPFTLYLLQMHKMREQVEGLNESFGEWCKRCFTKEWTVVSNLEGREKLLAIMETQTNIHGWFNFEFEPEKPEKNSDNPMGWQIRFEYTFHYQRPDMVVFAYPLMIHNQLLPLDMIHTDRPQNIDSYNTYQGVTYDAYDEVVRQTNVYNSSGKLGLTEPIFDDWISPNHPPHHLPLIKTLVSVDPSDKRWIINLDDISDDFKIKDIMLTYMKKVSTKMLRMYYSIFHIRLFRWDSTISYPDIDVDTDAKVSANFDMELTDMWHLVIYLNVNPFTLMPEVWEDLGDVPGALEDYFDSIGVTNPDNLPLEDLLDKIKDNMGQPDHITPGLPITNEKYYANYTIITHRDNDNAKIKTR